jgi:hypothetical protein
MLRSLVILGTCLVVGCASSAAPEETAGDVGDGQALSAAHTDLSAPQSKSALGSMNDHCGDAWCEGDFDLDFTKLVCDFTAKTCTFTVTVTDPGETDAKTDDRTFIRSCKMTALSSYADLMEKTGTFEDMTDGFFQKVDDCVAKVESSIPTK